MVTLNTLPDELMTCVFQKLESPNGLSNVALCCRCFCNLVLPVLYSSFTDNGALPRTPRFLSTIIRRPDLARDVKAFALTTGGHDAFPSGTFESDFGGTWRRFEALARERLCGDEILVHNWYDDFRLSVDAITTLVTILLPNVSTLDLSYHYLHRILTQTSRP